MRFNEKTIMAIQKEFIEYNNGKISLDIENDKDDAAIYWDGTHRICTVKNINYMINSLMKMKRAIENVTGLDLD